MGLAKNRKEDIMSKIFAKLKGMWSGKKKDVSENEDQESIWARYGIDEEKIQTNSLFEQEPIEPIPLKEGNLLENVAGMPTRASIEMMAGGLKTDKLKKHKDVGIALDALEEYQKLMEQRHIVKINDFQTRNSGTTAVGVTDEMADVAGLERAFECLGTFILSANKVVNSAYGFFASRSSNVQRLAPVFANLIVQANGLLSKLTSLDNLVGPYLVENDKMDFTYAEIIAHELAGGRSGGIVRKGIEDGDNSIDLNEKKVRKIFSDKETDTKDKIDEIRKMRKEKTEQARLGMKIPKLPAGLLKEQNLEMTDEKERKKLLESASEIADIYLSELAPLMTALNDVAESNEGSGKADRAGARDKIAEHFWMLKLLYHVRQNKEALMQVILKGFPEKITEEPQEYQDLLKLYLLRGSTLADAVNALNMDAQNEKYFVRLVDGGGKDLVENEDYIVGGGNASIAIIDKVNRQVLRTPKGLTEDKQRTVLNGINDEAVAQVSKFLGLDVIADAKAEGVMARGKGSTEENAIFGGSVMEMVDGKNGKNYQPVFSGWDQTGLLDDGKKQKFDITKAGKIVADLMKLSVVDYLVMHSDRHSGNFMLNPETEAGKSSVIGIDNDISMGMNGIEYKLGETSSRSVVNAVKDRTILDCANTLSIAFPMVTKEVKEIVGRLDPEAFREMLQPYTDRVMRIALVERAKELKAWVEKAPVFDENKEEDVAKLIHQMSKNALTEWIRGMGLQKDGELDLMNCTRRLPGTLVKWLTESYQSIFNAYGDTCEAVLRIKQMGFSREEAEALLKENLHVEGGESLVTEEQFNTSKLAGIMQDYDMSAAELWKKYKNKHVH